MLWCNAQRVSTQNVPGERVRYMDFYLAQPNHLGWDPTVGADGAADQGVVGILSQLTDALREFEEDHNVDKLATDAVKRAETRTVTEQLQALEEADKAMLSGVGAQEWEYQEGETSGQDREGKEEDQNKETKSWWWTAPFSKSYQQEMYDGRDTVSDEAKLLTNEHSVIVWETDTGGRAEAARLGEGEGQGGVPRLSSTNRSINARQASMIRMSWQ